MPKGIPPLRYDLASDNTAPIAPEAWAALAQANAEAVSSYGEDPWTDRACELVREVFEIDCEVFFVFNGTAANALALAQLCQPFHSVLCHEFAHIETDECGAPEFFANGAKLIPTRGANGKIDLGEVAAALARQHGLHSPKPRVLSITQATELGTVYTRAEIDAVSEFARQHELLVHMDGARFANAVASLGCAPKALTWEAGVDVLCFGGTKNGTAAGELVVFFDKARAGDFAYRAKQGGQLASKMRFLAAPWVGLLENGIWLRNAERANRGARFLAQELRGLKNVEQVYPCESNALFLRLGEQTLAQLNRRGWFFYKFVEPDVYRVMCSWATTGELLERFVADLREIAGAE